MERPKAISTLLVIALFVAPHGVHGQTAAPTFPDPGKASMSKENQRALGMEAAAQVYQQMPVLPDDSPESEYVRQLGQKLVATIPEQYSWPFEFHVIPEKDINAFALPGGQMFVNLGTITAARNEAELAGVMGHEMAHVYMQHSAKQAGKAQTTSVIAGIASVVLGETVGHKAGGLVGQLGQMGIQMGAQGLMMKYSRSDESQADAVGSVILYKAGYDPQAMVDFFKTMGAQAGAAPPQLFSSHPNPGNRQEAIRKQIANWPAAEYVVDSPRFSEIHEHAKQVKTYTAAEIQAGAKSGKWASINQQNGASLKSGSPSTPATTASSARSASSASSAPSGPVALQSVLPSQSMVSANLGPLKINHPENWPVTLPQQKGQLVTIAPPAGITQGGVGYGVLLGGASGSKGQRVSIDDMTAALVEQMQQSNDLQPQGDSKPVTVGGHEGRSTLLLSSSPVPDAGGQAQPERDWLVTVPRQDGSVIFLIFVAPQAEFDRLKPTFDAMLKSVQFR